MSYRRSHRKSRHGCLECKRRRIKCDETRPKCSSCSKRHTECEYESSSSFRWANEEPQVRQSSSGPSTPHGPTESQPLDPTLSTTNSLGIVGRLGENYVAGLEVPSTSLNTMDLELMFQWCNSTCHILSRDEEKGYIWRYLVTEEAFKHQFLMHGILAVSAIHLSRTRNDCRQSTYISVAIAHQNRALELFRLLLGNINESNAKAMFAFASIVVLYTFGFPHELEPSDPFASIDDLFQTIVLMRGVQQVINTSTVSLFDSDFSPLLKVKPHEHNIQEDAQLALEELFEANRSCGSHDKLHDTDIYEDAIYRLMKAMGRIHQDLNSMTVVGQWAIKANRRYVELVRNHAPLALVILSYYCVLLHYLRHHWHLDQWSVRVSKAIWMVLDDQWKPLVRWPLKQIFGQKFSDGTFSTT